MLYLYSGEQIIDDNGSKTVIRPGQCAFIRRDHRIVMYKNHTETEQYKGISLTFRRNMLREFYNKLSKNDIPAHVLVPEQKVFLMEPRPDITSLFQSLTPYFDTGIQPTEEIIRLKLQEGILCLLNTHKAFKNKTDFHLYIKYICKNNNIWKI